MTSLGVGATHRVFNQAKPLVGHNAFRVDAALRSRVVTSLRGLGEAGDSLLRAVDGYGAVCGKASSIASAARANALEPALETHDDVGRRVDRVAYDPSYHDIFARAFEGGVANISWREETRGLTSRAARSRCCTISSNRERMPADDDARCSSSASQVVASAVPRSSAARRPEQRVRSRRRASER